MEPFLAHRWSAVAALAAQQHGRVHVRQLLDLGLSKGAVDKAVASGRLHREHHGVYAVGFPSVAGRHGRWMGAVLAGGDGAVLSGRSAATLWGIRDGEGPRVEVTVPGRGGRRRAGIAFSRARLHPDERTCRDGIPVVSVARVLVELGSVLGADDLQWAVREAQSRRLFVLGEVRAALERHPSRRLAELLEDLTPVTSRLEDLFLRLLRRYGLPRPVGQERINGHRVDFVWPAQRLVVELDGRRAHETGDAFQRDRTQSNHLQLEGYLVLRFTWADVRRRPAYVAHLVERALGRETVPMES